MTEQQMTVVFILGIGVFILFIALQKLLAVPLRRKSLSAFAHQHGFVFVPRIEVSQLGAVFSHIRHKATGSDRNASQAPPAGFGESSMGHNGHLKISSPDLTDGSVIGNPRFFKTLGTHRIRNLCYGTYAGYPVEVFDHVRPRGRTWNQGRKSAGQSNLTVTQVAFRLPKARLPHFLIRPLVRESERNDPNVVQHNVLPDFHRNYIINALENTPDSVLNIKALLTAGALKTIADYRWLRIRGGDDSVVFTKGGQRLKPGEISKVLKIGADFVRALPE
jgi:hypothetical protein